MTPLPASTAATAKGASTRGMLLERACGMAARVGLEGVTIGELAGAAGMSKSGVFAHFGSREDLVRQTLDWAAEQFVARVMAPAMARPRGLPRLQAIIDAWIGWIADHPDGCVFLGAAMEYDGRPGPMRDHVATMMQSWRSALERAVALAVEQGHLRPGTDPALIAFQLDALMQGLHHGRLHQPQAAQDLARRAVEDLFARYRATGADPVPSAGQGTIATVGPAADSDGTAAPAADGEGGADTGTPPVAARSNGPGATPLAARRAGRPGTRTSR